MNKLFPIGIQNFEKLRLGNYVYVDKTSWLYDLVHTGQYYFLGRPRRFGKSLLISTLEAYFEGKKDLFTGLAIASLEKEWQNHPILHLDLNTQKYESTQSLEEILNAALCSWEHHYGADQSEISLSLRFQGVIRRAAETTGKGVVILVDEYDKPLLQAINNEQLQDDFCSTLKAFYGALKSCDKFIRFALLTGVTKFGKVSVCSDFNNLLDLSTDRRYLELCGITEQEIHRYFEDNLHELAIAQNITYEQVCERLKENYDGYHFTYNSIGLYNPFSLLNTFAKNEFNSYWFETGTPTYLVDLLKRHHYNLEDMEKIKSSKATLDSIDSATSSPIGVIFQSGYLTIKDYTPRFKSYSLGFPNREVEEGFLKFLLPYYTTLDSDRAVFSIELFVDDIENGKIDSFFTRLQTFFADTPYELAHEREVHYQNVLFIVFRLMGFYVKCEYHTNRGRIDLLLQTSRYIYIMEFKLNGTAEEALSQIKDKGYAESFNIDNRLVYKIGVNFSKTTRNIEKWMVE